MNLALTLSGLCLFLAVIWIAVSASEARLRSRLGRLERKLDALLAKQGIEMPCPLSVEVRQLAQNRGALIKAIKLHREQTGASLSDAKADVEAFLESGRA